MKKLASKTIIKQKEEIVNKLAEELKDAKLKEDGRLSDIAPTILDMMNLEKPEQMTGHSLIK